MNALESPARLVSTNSGPTAPSWLETALLIEGSQGPLMGIIASPPDARCHAAVLIVAGQPQTRVGAHRMFTELARALAARGIASLRFDVGGWGDSPGEPLPFENSDQDILAATIALRNAVPTNAPLWLWGLCDGASASLLALPALRSAGITPEGVCLVNPWVRSEASLSAAMVKTYYARRLMNREFWARLLSGKISLRNLLLEPVRHLAARSRRVKTPSNPAQSAVEGTDSASKAGVVTTADLPTQLLEQLCVYKGQVFTILSGNDLTAGETEALMRSDKRWRKRLAQRDLLLRVPGADHTFSDPEHWQQVCNWVARKAGG